MSGVKLENVSKIYENGFKAVDQVSLDIKEDEFIVLVGPSGCGKTTLLRMIAGLEKISEGQVWIDGTCVNEDDPKDRNIAMVFQSYALYPHMSVRDNIAFALKMAGVSKTERYKQVDQVAELLQLQAQLDKKPGALSGGQRQRVALGRAMVRNPKIFLLDEPLSNLDAKLRVQMRSEIVHLHRQLNTTFIYVTHDQIEALTMGDRIAVMSNGKVEQFDTPKALYHSPKNLFVAQFIGTPQMNLFPVTLVKEGPEAWLTYNHQRLQLPASIQAVLDQYPSGHPFIMGIRAENIHYLDTATRETHLKVQISNVEQVGSDTYAYFKLDPSLPEMVARFNPPKELSIGETLTIEFDPDHYFLFDQATQENILYQARNGKEDS